MRLRLHDEAVDLHRDARAVRQADGAVFLLEGVLAVVVVFRPLGGEDNRRALRRRVGPIEFRLHAAKHTHSASIEHALVELGRGCGHRNAALHDDRVNVAVHSHARGGLHSQTRRGWRLGRRALAVAVLNLEIPVEQRIVQERLEHRHHRVLVAMQHPHDCLTRRAEVALHSRDTHCVDEHAREPKGHGLGALVAMDCDLKTVAKINVHDLARELVKHQVGKVAIA